MSGTAALVIVAMPEEAEPFLAGAAATAVDSPLRRVDARRVRREDGTEFVLIACGVGMVAAAAAATWAIGEFSPQAIVSAGTAGGLSVQIEVGDVAVADALTYGTADATEFGYERGQVPGQPVRFPADPELVDAIRSAGPTVPGTDSERRPGAVRIGRILTSDTFVTARTVDAMRAAFPDAQAADMESGALAQTAAAFDVPFASVRGISDLCGPAAGQEFHIGVEIAAARSAAVVLPLLASLRR